MLASRAAGIALGVLADAVLGDPKKHHPVAWFGTWALAVERHTYRDDTASGALHVAATVTPIALAAVGLEYMSRKNPLAHTLATALVTWSVVGARSLAHEGETMAQHLVDGDLDGARQRLGNLCGRDPEGLDETELTRAAVESMAENTADAAVASLFWGSIFGIPGMVVHRCLNTLDAMVGHLNDRYRHFGTASARLDDAADWIPARLTGATACTLAPAVGGSSSAAWRIMIRDGAKHPSPNGGWCESAWAGALGVQLGGTNVYFSRTEERQLLGDGPRPRAPQLRQAARLVTLVTGVAAGTAAATLLALRKARR